MMKISDFCLISVLCFALLFGISSTFLQQVKAEESEIFNFTYDEDVVIEAEDKDVSTSRMTHISWIASVNPPYGSESRLLQKDGAATGTCYVPCILKNGIKK